MSSAVKFNKSLKILRNISHELKRLLKKEPIKTNETMVYILDMYRKHDMTGQRVCRSDQELQCLAETYYWYLNSSRNYRHIYDKFYRKGERSVAQTAQMLGFKLPRGVNTDPKVNTDH